MKKSKTILAVAIALMALATSCKEEEENKTLTGTVWMFVHDDYHAELGIPNPNPSNDTSWIKFITDTSGEVRNVHDNTFFPDESYSETKPFKYTYNAPSGVIDPVNYDDDENLYFTINGDTLTGTTGVDGELDTMKFYKQ